LGGVTMTRSDDAKALLILKLRTLYGAATAARLNGMKSEKVRTICNRILNDDLRASVKDGIETPDQVMSGYWSDLNG